MSRGNCFPSRHDALSTPFPWTRKFNDTFVYRGVSSLALTMVPVSAVWLLLALWLGVKYRACNTRQES